MYVLAHCGGWFEGARDNASKVATMLGLSTSRGFRGRSDRAQSSFSDRAATTTARVQLDSAPAKSNISGTWLFDNRETVFSKTALFINCEHTSTLLIYVHVAAKDRKSVV